jgi:hypothetical protein
LSDTTFNGGGRSPSSPATAGSFRITLDAIGDWARQPATSASFELTGGFVARYAPPDEVDHLRWRAGDTVGLEWDPEPSAGSYYVYRDPSPLLPGGADCLGTNGADPQFQDPAQPPQGTGFFYLVTVRNRVGEEGTLGFRSSGVERSNPAPCP